MGQKQLGPDINNVDSAMCLCFAWFLTEFTVHQVPWMLCAMILLATLFI